MPWHLCWKASHEGTKGPLWADEAQLGLQTTVTPIWRNQDMDTLQETQLNVMLRGILARLQSMEGGVQQALNKGGAAEEAVWDLFAQLLEHDHCELCGRAMWNQDHTC